VADGAGGFLATLTAPLLGARRGHGLVFVVTSLAAGVAMVLFGVQHHILPAAVLIFVSALMLVIAQTLCMMVTQLTTPDHLRGRVISLQALIVNAGIPGGTLLLGVWGSAIGVGITVSVAGALLALTSGVVLARASTLREVA
jgi:predicted MFS family arabinose efflux permease